MCIIITAAIYCISEQTSTTRVHYDKALLYIGKRLELQQKILRLTTLLVPASARSLEIRSLLQIYRPDRWRLQRSPFYQRLQVSANSARTTVRSCSAFTSEVCGGQASLLLEVGIYLMAKPFDTSWFAAGNPTYGARTATWLVGGTWKARASRCTSAFFCLGVIVC